MRRVVRFALTGILALVLGSVAAIAGATTRTLAFEQACLDLDIGVVDEEFCSGPPSRGSDDLPVEASWDIRVGYHADRAARAVIFQNGASEVEIAHLTGVAFDDVTSAAIAGASFTLDVVDQPFDAARVILVRTDRGAVYKLGNAFEDETGLRLDYELLSDGSPP